MATLTLTQAATAAAQFLGVLYSGEVLSTQQIADALAAANNMLDNWNSQKLLIAQSLPATFSLTGSTQSYTIGNGSTFNVAAGSPAKIEAAHLILASGPSSPIEVLNAKQWSRLADRQSTSWLVRYCFYDRGATSKVWFSPIPNGGSVELTMWVPLAQFADVTTALTMLPGYARLIKLALAVEIAPQYSISPSPALMDNLKSAITDVMQLNASLFGPDDGETSASAPPAQGTT